MTKRNASEYIIGSIQRYLVPTRDTVIAGLSSGLARLACRSSVAHSSRVVACRGCRRVALWVAFEWRCMQYVHAGLSRRWSSMQHSYALHRRTWCLRLRVARAFLSVTHRYIHTYIHTLDEMRCRIICLTLRRSAIIRESVPSLCRDETDAPIT